MTAATPETIAAELDRLAARLNREAVHVVRGGRAMLGEVMGVAARVRRLADSLAPLLDDAAAGTADEVAE